MRLNFFCLAFVALICSGSVLSCQVGNQEESGTSRTEQTGSGESAQTQETAGNSAESGDAAMKNELEEKKMETITLGAGCFWCVEAVFTELNGVQSVKSGYMGGHVKNPTYQQVLRKKTGHAEVCQIVYDPEVLDFGTILEVFWQTHDPTTLNRQGYDVGPQYRSAIFYHSDEQRELAEAYKEKLDSLGAFNAPIVTEITAASDFYPAEQYHDNYFALNPNQPYCQGVIVPKVLKFRKAFEEKLKPSVLGRKEASSSSKK